MITETKYLKSINGNENEFSRNYLRGPDAIFENWEDKELYIKFSHKNISNSKFRLIFFIMGIFNAIFLITYIIGLMVFIERSDILVLMFSMEHAGIFTIIISIFFLMMFILIFYWVYKKNLIIEFYFDKISDKLIRRKSIFSKKKSIKIKDSVRKISNISFIKIIRKVDVQNNQDDGYKIFLRHKKFGYFKFFSGVSNSQTMDYARYLQNFLDIKYGIKIKKTNRFDADYLDFFLTPLG